MLPYLFFQCNAIHGRNATKAERVNFSDMRIADAGMNSCIVIGSMPARACMAARGLETLTNCCTGIGVVEFVSWQSDEQSKSRYFDQ